MTCLWTLETHFALQRFGDSTRSDKLVLKLAGIAGEVAQGNGANPARWKLDGSGCVVSSDDMNGEMA